VRVWLNTFPRIGETADIARVAEDAGFFGVLLTDSQCLAPDPFVELGAVARVTDRLHLGTCTTNVLTRHVSVVANLAATLQAESSGRMHLGVARGDSAVRKVGLDPATPEQFGQALSDLRGLLAGATPSVSATDSSLQWLDPSTSATPVLGVASGPRSIAAVARHADGLILQVGTDPEVIRHFVELIRTTTPRPDFRILLYVIVGLSDDRGPDSTVLGVTPLLARMAAEPLRDLGAQQAPVAEAAAQSYSLATHGLSAAQGAVDGALEYAITGTVDECADQLVALSGTGCDELVVILGSMDTPTSRLLDLIRTVGTSIGPRLT
jgi:5,10-methylenetetrahydromethanopterin reductase